MVGLAHRPWVSDTCESYVQEFASNAANLFPTKITNPLHELVDLNRSVQEQDCFNLNPATNMMNPRAEAIWAARLSSRPCSVVLAINMK